MLSKSANLLRLGLVALTASAGIAAAGTNNTVYASSFNCAVDCDCPLGGTLVCCVVGPRNNMLHAGRFGRYNQRRQMTGKLSYRG